MISLEIRQGYAVISGEDRRQFWHIIEDRSHCLAEAYTVFDLAGYEDIEASKYRSPMNSCAMFNFDSWVCDQLVDCLPGFAIRPVLNS